MKISYDKEKIYNYLNLGVDHSVFKLIKFLEDALEHDDRFTAIIADSVENASKAELLFNGTYIMSVTHTRIPNQSTKPTEFIEFYIDKYLLKSLWPMSIVDEPFERNFVEVNKQRDRFQYLFFGQEKEAEEYLLKYILELDQNE